MAVGSVWRLAAGGNWWLVAVGGWRLVEGQPWVQVALVYTPSCGIVPLQARPFCFSSVVQLGLQHSG